MRKTPRSKIFLVVVFVLMIALPVLNIRWGGGEYSETENRLLASKPDVFLDNGSLNPEVDGQIKSWFEDHIGFREKFVKLCGAIKWNVFHQSPSEKVHIGKDGWLFYTGDENLNIASGTYTLEEETLKQILVSHLLIREKLQAQGIEYVIVLPVSKASIYPEYMYFGSGEVRETPVDIVADYLEANSDLKIIRLKEALLEAKKEGNVFYKTDTHWNHLGAYTAYRKIVEDMSQWNFCSNTPLEVDYINSTLSGELIGMMGLGKVIDPEEIKISVLRTTSAKKNVQTEKAERFYSAVVQEGIWRPGYYYVNNAIDKPSVLIFGDSMFEGFNITELLAEHFSELTYVFDYNIREQIVEVVNPDILIYEMTERYLNVFPEKNQTFIQP